MNNIVNAIFEQYGIYGIILVALGFLLYMAWTGRKNNWGTKIDGLCDKVDNINSKITIVEDKLDSRIDMVEEKISRMHSDNKETDKQEAIDQTRSVITSGQGDKLSKILKYYCKKINCDHIFMGSFHNGTTDIRGLHYCKFDVIIDEFKDPLHLHPNDIDFCSLYKDENIIAYGDLPYQMTHIDSIIMDVDDENNTLLELSDTLYRRSKGRGITSLGFACIHGKNGNVIGFIGCVAYDYNNMSNEELDACAQEIENIYNN